MINFYKNRFIYFIISGIIFLAGIVSIFINGVHMDITFKGGAVLKYEFTGDINTDEAADLVSSTLDGRGATCQTTTNTMTETQYLTISLDGKEGLSSEKQEILDAALKEKYPDASLGVPETSIVEPFIGAKFLRNGILAVILAFIGIVLYVWYSFRKIGGLSAGVMALVALVHDCFVVFFIFVIFKISLNENFIAALLTIIGFSVNDTIVIYDRIRENMVSRQKKKMSIDELVDMSINQSLSRSINTNLAVFVSILLVCVFSVVYGLDSITSFALPMTFGVISGCYSTICLAGPLWVSWKKHKENAKIKA